MARTASRVPPVWIVLVPLAVLAWLGVRAARNEAASARNRVAMRADAAAERLVHAIDVVAHEFAQGLPGSADPVTADDALAAARHLAPRWIASPDGRSWDAEGPAPEADETARTWVTDALDAADRLGDDSAGFEARAVFLTTAAEAAPASVAADVLLAAGWGAARAFLPRDAAPSSHPDLFEDVASDAGGFGDALRDRLVAAAAGEDPPAPLRATVARWDVVREAARAATTHGTPVLRLVARESEIGILVAAPVTLVVGDEERRACLLGEVPSTTMRERVAAEAEALAADFVGGLVEVVAPDGTAPVSAGTAPAESAPSFESWVSLRAPLDSWRVHVAAPVGDGESALGSIFLGAVVLAVGALAWGAFALRRAAAEQARLAAERQTFLDHVAHEVRTPAGALLALSEELASGRVPEARQPKYHAHLAEESRRLARLVEDTLDLSRLDAGRLVFERSGHDLRSIVAEGLRAAGAESRVTFRAPPEPVPVDVDAAALRRVVRNLADNALRHGAADPQPEVTIAVSGNTARIVVRDHGPGIDADEIPRIFERFRRRPSGTHETKGVGVGLAICREIARAHGGDVTVTSAPGRGATFVLEVPRAARGTPADSGDGASGNATTAAPEPAGGDGAAGSSDHGGTP